MDISINQAAELLKSGEVIGVPTDTIYGVSSLTDFGDKIYEVKKRDRSKKLVTMISDVSQINVTDKVLLDKMNEVWPGAVTLIFDYEGEMTSFRIPAEPNLLKLIDKVGKPIFTTSANISGEEPCLSRQQFKLVFPEMGLLEEQIVAPKSSVPSEIYIYTNGEFERIR